MLENLFHPLEQYTFDAPSQGLRVRMDITNKCNLLCKMCFYPGTVHESKFDMEPALMQKIVEQVFPHAATAVLSCAYEPFMSRHVDEVLEIVSRGPCRSVGFVTNATLWNERRIRAMLQNRALESIAVSIDGASAATFERIRVNGNWSKLLRNIEMFAQLKRDFGTNRPSLQLNTVLLKSTVHELPELVKLAVRIGAVKVEGIRYVPMGTPIDEEITDWEAVMPILVQAKQICHDFGVQLFLPVSDPRLDIRRDSAAEANCNVAEVGEHSQFCEAPWRSLQIRANGDVHPCNYYQKAFGNLREQDFSEIWNSRPYLELRRSLVRMRLHKQCAACNPHGYDNTEGKARINS